MKVTLESSGALLPVEPSLPRSTGIVIGFWIVSTFCHAGECLTAR